MLIIKLIHYHEINYQSQLKNKLKNTKNILKSQEILKRDFEVSIINERKFPLKTNIPNS